MNDETIDVMGFPMPMPRNLERCDHDGCYHMRQHHFRAGQDFGHGPMPRSGCSLCECAGFAEAPPEELR
jgi:hypothetical protein